MWDLFLSDKLETLEAIYSVQATEKKTQLLSKVKAGLSLITSQGRSKDRPIRKDENKASITQRMMISGSVHLSLCVGLFCYRCEDQFMF